MVLSEYFAMGSMPCEGGAKSVPHLKTKPFICLAFSCQNMKRLRNRIVRKIMIFKEKIVDCKSAHAGSIPASASTFESPADSRLRGFFMAAEKGDVFRKMKLWAVGCGLSAGVQGH